MSGSITTLGVGSGIDLQGMLESLREVDNQVVDTRQEEITTLETQINELTSVNNKLLSLKSIALDLSLSSTFIGRTISSSDEDTMTATVLDGAEVDATQISVTNMAQQSSWMSASGMAGTDSIVYVPTSQESTTGTALATGDAGYLTQDDTLTITYGSGDSMQTIDITITGADNMSMDQLVTAINEDDENGGVGTPSLYVTADTYTVGTENFLRISSTAGGTGETERVMITDQLDEVAMAAPDKTFAYQVGDDTGAIVSVAADTTMQQLVDLINDDSDNPGATASIIDDGVDSENPYRLVLKADEYGEDNRITFLSQLPDITMAESASQAADDSLNAQISVDGIDYQRQTNSIDDVITAVKFELKDIGNVTLTVGNNDEDVTEMITTMVEAYNEAIQEIDTQSGYDFENEEFGSLYNTTIRGMDYDLNNLMTTINKADSEGNITSMYDLGLEYNQDGTITIDASTLSTALSENSDGVQAFFLGDSDNDVEGFADTVNNYLRTLTSGEGVIEAEKSSANTKIDNLEVWIEAETARLDKRYDLMTKQFISLDTYMNQMTSISDYLSSQFDSISGGWGGVSSSD